MIVLSSSKLFYVPSHQTRRGHQAFTILGLHPGMGDEIVNVSKEFARQAGLPYSRTYKNVQATVDQLDIARRIVGCRLYPVAEHLRVDWDTAAL